MFKIFKYVYLLNKYLKCSFWRLALRYDIYIYVVRLQKVKTYRVSGSTAPLILKLGTR